MSKIKNGALDQYGAELFEQQQFGTADVERVKTSNYVLVFFVLCVFLRCEPFCAK